MFFEMLGEMAPQLAFIFFLSMLLGAAPLESLGVVAAIIVLSIVVLIAFGRAVSSYFRRGKQRSAQRGVSDSKDAKL